jgi:hypothetical protein
MSVYKYTFSNWQKKCKSTKDMERTITRKGVAEQPEFESKDCHHQMKGVVLHIVTDYWWSTYHPQQRGKSFQLGFTFYYYNNASIRAATTMFADFFSRNHNSCPSHDISYYYSPPRLSPTSIHSAVRQSAVFRTLGTWISTSKDRYFPGSEWDWLKNRAR